MVVAATFAEANGATVSTQSVVASDGDDTAKEYASLGLSEGEDEGFKRWWLGSILAVHLRRFDTTIYIGPHWYCSIMMFGVINLVGWCATTSSKDALQAAGTVLATLLTVVAFLRCALASPGVLRHDTLTLSGDVEGANSLKAGVGLAAEAARSVGGADARLVGPHCRHCNLRQPPNCHHCEWCQVCVLGFDHHCVWMGKCIGAENICKFYTFIATSLSSLLYIFVMALVKSV
eukprot:TRINITY_DN76460_c0_g1_i1.p1 TRINITY_DN76460_c0_g1~~TRINITY_DN76460_c0_g1_i1.p1  ORF type:complete len:257 (+),score=38.27 TRINITY_DN76460_c0_g1_i1:74-772(+)